MPCLGACMAAQHYQAKAALAKYFGRSARRLGAPCSHLEEAHEATDISQHVVVAFARRRAQRTDRVPTNTLVARRASEVLDKLVGEPFGHVHLHKLDLPTHDRNTLAPALRILINVAKGRYIQVAPGTVWSLAQRSRDVGRSLAQAIRSQFVYQTQVAAMPVPTRARAEHHAMCVYKAPLLVQHRSEGLA